jgi:hypothetical protein
MGYKLGLAGANETIARLDRISPGVQDPPERDRAALAGSALYCGLNSLPAAAPPVDVFACLRRGAAKMIERDPASDLPSRLERMIREAAISNVAPEARG